MKKSRRFPAEPSSRRPGWTEGEPIRLADGELWYLPAIDYALIPSMNPLVGNAKELIDYVVMLRSGEIGPDDPAMDVMNTWFRVFLLSLLRMQYRNRDRTLCELIDLEGEAMDRMVAAVFGFLNRFDRFVGRRLPVGIEGASVLAELN